MVIPTDSASPKQREKYQRYVDERTPRTRAPQGPKGMLFAADLIGTSDQIAEQLYAHAGFQEVDEVAFALPFSFDHEDYVQILTDIATNLGPALGWTPAAGRATWDAPRNRAHSAGFGLPVKAARSSNTRAR